MSKYYQIRNFYPYLKKPEKYIDRNKVITARSGWEIEFMQHCDRTDSILEWSSESIIINYFFPIDNKMHRYFIDFWIKTKQKDGNLKEFLIEIKPYAQTLPPKMEGKRKTKYLKESIDTFIKNKCKWDAAKKYCETQKQQFNRNLEFIILTEKDGIFGQK